MQHFGILRRELKEGIRYNESKELQEIVIERKRRNQSVIGARDIFQGIAGLLERDVSTISREINLASMNKHTYRGGRSQGEQTVMRASGEKIKQNYP